MATQGTKKPRGTRKPEALFGELAENSLRQHRGDEVTGPTMVFKFSDGSVARVPAQLVKDISASQHGRYRGMLAGKLGGRPIDSELAKHRKRPSADELFLMFRDHSSGSVHRYAIARRTFLQKLRKEYGVSLKTARRWTDAVLGKRK